MPKYSVRKNWLSSIQLLKKRPKILLPFLIIAFLETLALELIYFSCRKPLACLFNPLIIKFTDERYVHYPGNLVILPNLFFYAQVVIYLFIGVVLTAICVAMAKNTRESLPLKAKALIKGALRRYLALFLFGVTIMVAMFLLRKGDEFIFLKALKLAGERIPQIFIKLAPFIFTFFVFLTNVILQAFLILTVPVIVIKKKFLFTALGESIILGWRNFLSLFMLLSLPFLVYLPITLLKTATPKLMDKISPEVSMWITAVGIIVSLFTECFIIVCATQFLLDKENTAV